MICISYMFFPPLASDSPEPRFGTFCCLAKVTDARKPQAAPPSSLDRH